MLTSGTPCGFNPIAYHRRAVARFLEACQILDRPPHFPAPVGVFGCSAGQILLVRLFGHVFLIHQPQRAGRERQETRHGVMNLERQFRDARGVALIAFGQEFVL